MERESKQLELKSEQKILNRSEPSNANITSPTNANVLIKSATPNPNQKFNECINQVIYINARSILKNFAQIEILVAKYRPMILICSESRVTDSLIKSDYAIKNYNQVECFSQSRSIMSRSITCYGFYPLKFGTQL